MRAPKDLAASIASRLLDQARSSGRPYDELLTYYSIERFLFRLASTPHRDRLVLKGALMLPIWGGPVARPTRDIDFLGRGSLTASDVTNIVIDSIAADVEDDGMEFDASTLVVSEIREHERYGGLRATFRGRMGRSRVKMQLDIGLGDAVTPGVIDVTYPTLLDFPAPALKGYPRETSIAEKLEAIVDLGLANSRMKDYFDLWTLTNGHDLDGDAMVAAVRATFERRGTAIPTAPPIGLTSTFAEDAAKQSQWSGFTRRLRAALPSLSEIVARVAQFALPIFDGSAATRRWIAGTTWRG